jgi:hypothetical protein
VDQAEFSSERLFASSSKVTHLFWYIIIVYLVGAYPHDKRDGGFEHLNHIIAQNRDVDVLPVKRKKKLKVSHKESEEIRRNVDLAPSEKSPKSPKSAPDAWAENPCPRDAISKLAEAAAVCKAHLCHDLGKIVQQLGILLHNKENSPLQEHARQKIDNVLKI